MGCWSAWHRLLRECRASNLQEFWRLPGRDRLRLSRAVALLAVAEAALRWRSFSSLTRTLECRVTRAHRCPLDEAAVRHLAVLITIADTHGPFPPSCLRCSLALSWWLGGRGVITTLRIGVAQDAGRLRAHAWVDVEGPTRFSVFADPAYAVLESAPTHRPFDAGHGLCPWGAHS